MKGKSQLKRCSDETAKLLLSSRCAVTKEKPIAPVFIRPVARTARNVAGLHFEFPDGERHISLTKVISSHRRVSSTESGKNELGAQLMRIYNLIRTAYPSVPEVQDSNNEKLVLQHIEAGVVLVMTQMKAKEQEHTLDSAIEQQRSALAAQEAALEQVKADFDEQQKQQSAALQKREEALQQKEAELQQAAAQLEKDRVASVSACAVLRKRLKAAEQQLKALQQAQAASAKSSHVQNKLKDILKQESMLNAVAEDLQYQRSSLLARLETTLTEIAPPLDAESKSDDLETPMDSVLKDCSNLLSTRDTRSRSKGSTQEMSRLFRTLSRERPVDITEIYSEIEEERRRDPLDLTPKGVLTPKSMRSSRSLFEEA